MEDGRTVGAVDTNAGDAVGPAIVGLWVRPPLEGGSTKGKVGFSEGRRVVAVGDNVLDG